MKTFAEWYKNNKKPKKQELATSLGVSLPTLSLWANGLNWPTLPKALEMKRLIGISVYSWDEIVDPDGMEARLQKARDYHNRKSGE